MYRVMTGLDTYEDGVGYKHIRIKPHIGGGFTEATASLQTYYGKLASSWKITGDRTSMEVTIPANTNATVYIPAKSKEAVSEANGAMPANGTMEDGYLVVNLGSGTYQFSTNNKQ
jgi:alpha-L-rhamnosidase